MATEGQKTATPPSTQPWSGELTGAAATRLPRLPRKYVPRIRLWESLEDATESAVTVLVAPVGAGKTLGVVGWLHAGAHPDAVWIAASADLSVSTVRRLASLKGPDGGPRLLVVDDAQTLSATVLDYLDKRLSEDPRNLRLLLISRWDLPFTRLVPELLGDLTVLRGDLMRLTEDEVRALVAEHARTDSAEVCAAISARTDGWCAAVVLAARAVAGEPDPPAAARRLMSGSSVADKVASEVFAALSARQRHLLLCVAGEEITSPAVACHLTNDEDADRLLEDLESTGMLVTRFVDAHQSLGGETEPDDEQTSAARKYRLHPLLLEVVRRRITSGGVDVERARSTVRRAVALDVECGELHDALHRLIAIGAVDSAKQLLVEHGVALVLAGEADALGTLVRHHAAHVEADPMCALPMALHNWFVGDLASAQHWLQRMDRQVHAEHVGGDASTVWELELAVAQLMRARLGDGLLAEAVALAVPLVERAGSDTSETSPLVPLLKLHLGAAMLQVGPLADADRYLTDAMRFGRSTRLFALAAEARSELALSQFLQGREHACLELAEDIPRDELARAYAPATLGGVLLARRLARLQSVVDPDDTVISSEDMAELTDPSYEADAVAAALNRLLTARSLLLRGHAADAQRALSSDSTRPWLPSSVLVAVLLEQALQAALASDSDQLSRVQHELEGLSATGEAAYVSAVRAEVQGDTRAAVELFAAAASGSTCLQPPVAALALTGRAQLLYGEGRRAEAVEHVRSALTATEVRRNALPFLGWSRHGAAMGILLRAVLDVTPSRWCQELVSAMDAQPAIMSTAGALTATPRERARVADGVVRPTLSPRERDVLHELARGATYADVAANLFVSENTVKTHVSSLYAKLAVSRRSDALAVARTLALL